MKLLSEVISVQNINGFSDYFSLNKKIDTLMKENNLYVKNSLNIALVSSFTVNGIKEILRVKCAEFNVLANCFVGGYSQYAQEILDPKSSMYKFNPDLVIIFIDTKAIAGDLFFLPYEMSHDNRRVWIDEKVDELSTLARTVTGQSKAKVILHNLEEPIYSPLGLIENKQDIGFIEAIEMINKGLRDCFKKNNQVFVFDYNAFCSQVGKQNVMDYKMYYLGDIKLNPQFFPHLCNRYIGYVRSLSSLTKKCIVLDLDNTLWGGVVGEDGLEGIHLGPTPEGRPFLEFQKLLLSLFNRGVILAVNSKNNSKDALDVLQKHPSMVLKEKHFAAIRINWEDKVTNMRSLSEEINISLDSMVFVDDDPLNREMVKSELPEVLVIDLPEDPALYLSTLQNMNEFDTLQLTDEDKKKGKMYQAQRKRKDYQKHFTSLNKYLTRLEIEVTIGEATPFTIPRLSQMTQKTNQYNLTTRRYTEEDICNFANQSDYRVIALSVKDKFGDNGLTGMCIVKYVDSSWEIDSWLLSCRIIGRKIEDVLLAYVLEEARKNNVGFIRGIFIPSKKNHPARSFFKDHGFKKIDTKNTIEYWEYDVVVDYPYPTSIKLIRK